MNKLFAIAAAAGYGLCILAFLFEVFKKGLRSYCLHGRSKTAKGIKWIFQNK